MQPAKLLTTKGNIANSHVTYSWAVYQVKGLQLATTLANFHQPFIPYFGTVFQHKLL